MSDSRLRERRAREEGHVKTPKRVSGWVPVPRNGTALAVTREEAGATPNRRIARVVELRRGEVIVDVEALVTSLRDEWLKYPTLHSNKLRAALRKVGKR